MQPVPQELIIRPTLYDKSNYEKYEARMARIDQKFSSFAEKIFDLPKPVAKVAHSSFSHVIHFSITL